jgi:hypothetical protein
MPANTSPVFGLTPVIGVSAVSTVNTNRDGSTGSGYTDILTGGTNGTIISRITMQFTVTTTAGMVRLYVVNGSGTRFLYYEQPVTAVTPSGSAQAARYVLSGLNLILPSGWKLTATINNAENVNVVAEGSDL